MQITKQFADGGTLTVAYNGQGNGSITLSAQPNEGLDRELDLQVVGGGISAPINVTQAGKREIFTQDWQAKDGTFNVLKHGIQ